MLFLNPKELSSESHEKCKISSDIHDNINNQNTSWSKGVFNEIARQNVVLAEALVQEMDPHPGQKVLDLACVSGTTVTEQTFQPSF